MTRNQPWKITQGQTRNRNTALPRKKFFHAIRAKLKKTKKSPIETKTEQGMNPKMNYTRNEPKNGANNRVFRNQQYIT